MCRRRNSGSSSQELVLPMCLGKDPLSVYNVQHHSFLPCSCLIAAMNGFFCQVLLHGIYHRLGL